MGRSMGMLGYWPGLLSLWRYGRMRGLVLAVAFAILLNGAVIASFVYPEQVPQQARYLLWAVLIVGWWIATRTAARHSGTAVERVVCEVNEGLFLQAQAEYLKGHWFEAETPLREILKINPEDSDARLLLAGLLRRSARHDEARRQLGRLAKMPSAQKWEAEIRRELALLSSRSRLVTQRVELSRVG